MKPLLTTRWPVFEFSIFLVVVLIGWAEFELYRTVKPQVVDGQILLQGERQLVRKLEQNARDRQQAINGLHQTVNGLQQSLAVLHFESNETRKIIAEVENVFQGELEELHKEKFVDAHNLPEVQRVQDEYLSIADAVGTNIDQLQAALNGLTDPTIFRGRLPAGKEPPEVARFDEKCHQFNDWIVRQKERIGAERFPAKSQELQEKVAGEQLLSSAGRPVRITKDMGNLLEEISHNFTNYLEEARQMIANVRKDVPRDAVNKRLENARAEAGRLTESAKEARASGDAIKDYMTAQFERDPARRTQRQKAAMKAFISMRTRLDSIRPPSLPVVAPPVEAALADHVQPAAAPPIIPAISDHFTFESVLYLLVSAQLGLGIFLMVAIYRKVVVDKLRLRLYETATEGKLAHLGQLAAWLAHEIKQPLTAINVWLWTLQKGVTEGSPAHMGTTAIGKEIQRMDQIVKDFLRFTQPALPKLAPLSAEPVLREVQDLLGPELARQHIQLHLDESLVDARFSADPQQLKQVLINLVKNAAESIQQNGDITLRVRNGKAPLRGQRAEVVIIEVADTGSGIPLEVQPRLFDPFFSTKEDGTGLGLPIAANIIEKHGGALEFETELGKGTTFAIVLPVLQEDF